MRVWLAIGVVCAVSLTMVGCVKDNITTKDMQDVRKEMSQETYEEAMKKAGRQDELAAEKKARDARRNENGDNF
ncbi:MAG: hypothetical protein ACKVQS_05795 [Fimbriimonadaceae bacterium]